MVFGGKKSGKADIVKYILNTFSDMLSYKDVLQQKPQRKPTPMYAWNGI